LLAAVTKYIAAEQRGILSVHAPWKVLLMRKAAGMRRRNVRWKQVAIFASYLLGITVFFLRFKTLMKASKNQKYGCSVCRKKTQLSPFQKATTPTTSSLVLVFERRPTNMTTLFVKDAEELFNNTYGL